MVKGEVINVVSNAWVSLGLRIFLIIFAIFEMHEARMGGGDCN